MFANLEPDERVALLDEVRAPVAARLMQDLSPQEWDLTADIRGYPKKSIGRQMSAEVYGIAPDLTAARALGDVRSVLDYAETIYTLPVTEDRVLLGVVSLRDLMTAPPDTAVTDIMRLAESARATELAEDAARRCADGRLVALPVVDSDNRLVGILTVDDALRIIEEADGEDQDRLSGSEYLRQRYLTTSVGTLVRSRVVWLLVLAIGAALTVQVLDVFEATLAEVVTLALFVPLLIGTGGNTGNQAATTITRALALRDVATGDIGKVLAREFRVGLSLGLILGSVGLVITGLIFGRSIGLVIGLTCSPSAPWPPPWAGRCRSWPRRCGPTARCSPTRASPRASTRAAWRCTCLSPRRFWVSRPRRSTWATSQPAPRAAISSTRAWLARNRRTITAPAAARSWPGP